MRHAYCVPLPPDPPAATPTPTLVLALAAPGDDKLSYDQLRQAIREALDSITAEQLQELIDSMQQRCQNVINAQGGHTMVKGVDKYYLNRV